MSDDKDVDIAPALDRVLQRRILEVLSTMYPEGSEDLAQAVGEPTPGARALLVNVQYLAGHDLIESGYRRRGMISDNSFSENFESIITHKGLDFIADDGGLGAILNTITVRLDATQWAELLASKVEALPGVSPEEKSSMAKALRSLPAKAIEKVSSKLLDWAVDHAADALPLLRMLLAQAAGSGA